MLKMRIALLSLALTTLVSAGQKDVLAGDITNLIRRPLQRVSPVVPFVDVSTAVPTTDEIRAVPAPNRDSLRTYPGNVLRYGANVSPSARIFRQNSSMFNRF